MATNTPGPSDDEARHTTARKVLAEACKLQLRNIKGETGFDAPGKYEGSIATEMVPYHATTKMLLKLDFNRNDRAAHSDRSLTPKDAEAQIRREFERRSELDWVRQAAGFATDDETVATAIEKECHELCTTCKGTASVTCAGCNGAKKIKCHNRDCNSGRVKCGSCQNGQRRCDRCYGSGQLQQRTETKVTNNATGAFHYVIDNKTVTCTECSGTQYSGMCFNCLGQSTVSCSTCSGTSKVVCSNCKGKGVCTCGDCRSGTRYITLTGLPNVEQKTSLSAENKSRLDTLLLKAPGALSYGRAKGVRNVRAQQDSLHGHLEYDAQIYAAVVEQNSDLLVVVGSERSDPFVSKTLRKEAAAPVSQLLEESDLKGLNVTPLGQSVLAEIRKPGSGHNSSGALATYDGDRTLEGAAHAFRNAFTEQVNKGARGSRWLIYFMALLLPLFAYESHVLSGLLSIGVDDWRIVLGLTLLPALVASMIYAALFKTRRKRMLRHLGIGDIALPSLKVFSTIAKVVVLALIGHTAILSLPMKAASKGLHAINVPLNIAEFCTLPGNYRYRLNDASKMRFSCGVSSTYWILKNRFAVKIPITEVIDKATES